MSNHLIVTLLLFKKQRHIFSDQQDDPSLGRKKRNTQRDVLENVMSNLDRITLDNCHKVEYEETELDDRYDRDNAAHCSFFIASYIDNIDWQTLL